MAAIRSDNRASPTTVHDQWSAGNARACATPRSGHRLLIGVIRKTALALQRAFTSQRCRARCAASRSCSDHPWQERITLHPQADGRSVVLPVWRPVLRTPRAAGAEAAAEYVAVTRLRPSIPCRAGGAYFSLTCSPAKRVHAASSASMSHAVAPICAGAAAFGLPSRRHSALALEYRRAPPTALAAQRGAHAR